MSTINHYKKEITRGRLYSITDYYDDEGNLIKRNDLVTIPNQQRFRKGVFLVYDCSWDAEEGLGIRIVDEQITRVDNQGIAL